MATGSFSDYLEKKRLDFDFGATSYTPPATHYYALWTDTNSDAQRDAGSATEVSTLVWTNYQRAVVANNTTTYPAATGTTATKTNAVAIGPLAFLTSGSSIAAIASAFVTAVGIYDAASGGNLIGWFPLAQAKQVSNGDTFTLPAGAVSLSQD